MTYYGYGVNVSELHLEMAEEQATQLLEIAPKLGEFVEQFDNLKKQFGLHVPLEPAASKLYELAASVLGNTVGMSPVVLVLQLLFQVQEHVSLVGVVDDEGNEYLMLESKQPWEMSQTEHALTRESFNAMLQKYVGVLSDEEHIVAADLVVDTYD